MKIFTHLPCSHHHRLLVVLLIAYYTLSTVQTLAQASYFYPNTGPMNPQIPTPEQFLGYGIGQHQTRYDKMVEYFRELDRLSDRVKIEVIGESYERRPLIMASFTDPANYNRWDEIKKGHLARATQAGGDNLPMVIQIGATVHGNETSGCESTLLTAYYLTACENEEVKRWMREMIVFVEPVLNPDGKERFTNWVNAYKGEPLVSDANDREHNEIWPGGRMNHYWFDPNRDWFLTIHPEAKAQVKFFHQWRPYVVVDHHEMGTNSSFYFDPGKNSSNNPIVPNYLYDVVYPKFGSNFSEAFNKIGSMYYTKESFDKLYPGYGSDYCNFYGGAGFLFEQASSRGILQETNTIPITFAFTIRNQFTGALTTIRTALAEKPMLLNMRRSFYQTTANQAKASAIKGYIFGDPNDATRTNAFIDLLLRHQIEVYEVDSAMTAGNRRFEKGKTYLVPTEQQNYLMVRSAFEKSITYADSLFYDASTWSLVHAFNLPYAELKAGFAKGKQIIQTPTASMPAANKSEYAYLIDLSNYNAHKALYHLQNAGVICQTAFKPFTTLVGGKERNYGYGTIVIPIGRQTLSAEVLYETIKKVSEQSGVEIASVSTGYNLKGIDLGSNNVRSVQKPQALMLVGVGVSAYEAGEVWHLLDQRIGMPITKADVSIINRIDLTHYNTMVMVSGQYNLDKAATDRIKAWIQNGGTLITLKTAAEWAIRQGISRERIIPADTTAKKQRYNYEDAAAWEGAKNVGGSIFEMDLDLTHPIGFGYTERKVSIYRNGLTLLQTSKSPYNTVGQYTASPLIGGYLHPATSKRIANSAAILVSGEGAGRVILFSDNPNFRGIWYGTNKLFLNALFFGSVMTVPSFFGEEEK